MATIGKPLMSDIVDVIMPKLGESITMVTILKWLKKEGDFVREDEPLVEVTTDKVNSEIPAPSSGVIQVIDYFDNEEVAVGKRICVLGSEKIIIKEPFLSPVVKKLVVKYQIAREDLKLIKGSGIKDRITKTDIETFLQAKKKPTTSISPLRKVLIHNLEKVAQEVPAASMMIHVDFTQVMRKVFDTSHIKITPTAIMIWALGKVLMDYPKLYATYIDGSIQLNKDMNIGFAASVGDDLYVPVLHKASSYSLEGLAEKLEELKKLVLEKKLTHKEMQDGHFTLTNFGMGGVEMGIPMLQRGEVTILGMGAIKKTVEVEEINGMDHMVIKKMAYLSVTFDHRVVDGMYVSSFLTGLKSALETVL